MTLKEVKMKALALIEELNPDSVHLTDDPDISAKINHVVNQVQFELARMKKIPKYAELAVSKGDIIDFLDIKQACGYEIYQLGTVSGASYTAKANGTVLKVLEDGTLEIDCYVYPERITDENQDDYVFELSADALEIMPYGVAADLLKSDVSADYGTVYANRYETMLQRLDPRYSLPSISIEGGVSF